MNTKKLCLIGKVFSLFNLKIKKEKSNEYYFQEIDGNCYLNDIIFSKNAIVYHMPHLYEELLNSSKIIIKKE